MLEWRAAGVIVLGGSSGIGLSISAQLLARGAQVMIGGRDPVRLAAALRQARGARAEVCDVTNDASVRHLVAEATRVFGHIDVLVNAAGEGLRGPAARTAVEDARSVLEVNYLGGVRAALAVLPQLSAQGAGIIVNVASVAGLHGVPQLAAYGASKAALVTFTQALRVEVANRRIRLINVYPDYTSTPFFDREKRIDGARPPEGPYACCAQVAQRIISAMETGQEEVVLSRRGWALRVLGGLAPGFAHHLLLRRERRTSP